jgi:ATP-dependent RNA helicase RhlE
VPRANRLARFLDRHHVACERTHGNRSQAQRTQALAGFKARRFRVLVATDIAARGIDVEALSHVINFDVPLVPDDYIHRVGRTARAELTGDAFTFARRGGRAPRDRAGDRQAAAARHAAGLRLRGAARGAVGDSDRRAHPERTQPPKHPAGTPRRRRRRFGR